MRRLKNVDFMWAAQQLRNGTQVKWLHHHFPVFRSNIVDSIGHKRNGAPKTPENIREIPIIYQNDGNEKKFTGEDKKEAQSDKNQVLYENHIPTTFFQKSILSFGSALTALIDPKRHDMVAVFGETTSYPVLRRLYNKMLADSEGQQILLDKPRINSRTVDLKALAELPEGTLGYAYVKFLNDNSVTPDSRLPVQFVDDPELAYVMQRYREGHDMFHTVLGMPTNMLGEVSVKWVEGLQTGLPMCIGGAIFGPLRFKPKQRKNYINTYMPWAVRVGRSSKLLMNVYFEKRWNQSLEELRIELNIETPP